MCTSIGNNELNRLMECGIEAAPTLIVNFGPYMNWGRWNHNTTRITPLIDHLLENGFDVQLQHSDEETTWEDHGFVRILLPQGEEQAKELEFSPMVQHNRCRSRPQELIQMGDEAMEMAREKK